MASDLTAGSLNRARNGRILVQGQVRPRLIIVASVRFQNPAQMCLAQDNDVVHAFTPDRSDQPFGKAILPRRGWCNWLISDAHGAKSACDNGAVDAIAVPDHITRSPSQGKASVIWRATHSAVGLGVTLIKTRSLRSSRKITKP